MCYIIQYQMDVSGRRALQFLQVALTPFLQGVFVIGDIQQYPVIVAGGTISCRANKGVVPHPANFSAFCANSIFLRETLELLSGELVDFLGNAVQVFRMDKIRKRYFPRFKLFAGISVDADVVGNKLDRPPFVVSPDEQCYCIVCSGRDFRFFHRIGGVLEILRKGYTKRILIGVKDPLFSVCVVIIPIHNKTSYSLRTG